VDKSLLVLFMVVAACSGLITAQVIGSYKTSTTSITLGKTTVTYSTMVLKDNDMLIMCPGIQIGMPRNMTSKQVSIYQTRLQKIDFKKCVVYDVDAQEVVSGVVITTKVVG
jgi:hypothetical protein